MAALEQRIAELTALAGDPSASPGARRIAERLIAESAGRKTVERRLKATCLHRQRAKAVAVAAFLWTAMEDAAADVDDGVPCEWPRRAGEGPSVCCRRGCIAS